MDTSPVLPEEKACTKDWKYRVGVPCTSIELSIGQNQDHVEAIPHSQTSQTWKLAW